MDALFIGHAYTDITFVTDKIPKGDEKYVGQDYAISIGGNAVVAAFTNARFGAGTSLIAPVADDRLGDVFLKRCAQEGIRTFPRAVDRSSVSLILPNKGKRAIVRCRDTDYLEGFHDEMWVNQFGALHVDGHQADAALYYAKECREKGVLTSLDGGSFEREGVEELLDYIDVAVVSMRFVEQRKETPEQTLDYLKSKGCAVAAVTMGDKGLIWREARKVETLPALKVKNVVDSTGAGDIFHGAYIYSYMQDRDLSWEEHFTFARAAATLSLGHLGTEASIPTLEEVEEFLGS